MTLWLLVAALPSKAAVPVLNGSQQAWLAEQIFSNECGSRPACLTAWNPGEDFPSLGIGHFIWYRANQTEKYEETFPALLRFMEDRGARLPPWLDSVGREQPWPDRAAFNADQESPRLRELRAFLAQEKALQGAFIVSRFEAALPKLLAASEQEEHDALRLRFNAIASAAPPLGLYALIDYVHFKGEGTSAAERYGGEGWGLLQVLQGIPEGTTGSPLEAFVASARMVLARRVALAPPERDEGRWLAGWNARLDSYLPATDD